MRQRLGLFLSIGIIAMLALVACGGDDDGDGNGDGNGNGGAATDVEMGEFYFDPDTLSGAAGDEISLNFDNVGSQEHNFVIDEWDVEVDNVPAGETGSTSLTVPDDASGEIAYYCSIPGHRESGMEGTFTVE